MKPIITPTPASRPIAIIGRIMLIPTASSWPNCGVSPDRCITVARVSPAWRIAPVTIETSQVRPIMPQ